MSNETEFDTALREQENSLRRSHRASRRRNLLIWLLAMVAVLFGAVCLFLALDNAGLAAANSAYGKTQQQEKQNLAAEFEAACKTADFQQTPAGQAVCRKAERVASDPGTPQPGPQGIQGPQGIPGPLGPMGPAGPKGDTGLAGVIGQMGAAGQIGAPGAAGPTGPTGPPGPAGPAGPGGADGAPGPMGPAGPAGANGTAPSSITFTDRTGATYTCTPTPPGSSTYTCASDGKLIP